MITKHTAQSARIGGVIGSSRAMAVGVGRGVVGALLLVAVLLASRAGALPIGFSVSNGTGNPPAALGVDAPLSRTGSAADGSAYMQYLLAGPLAEPARPVATNLSCYVPISGTSAAYDGSAYVQYLLAGPWAEPGRPVAKTPNVPISGTGSAYHGRN